MIPQPIKNTIETHGLNNSQAFRVNINAHTFDLLTAKLYKNPKQSIIRELVSNAWDAHVEAGTTDQPIEVFFPTPLDNSLIIKDYGTGLSKEKVYEIYTVLFQSTRQESNVALGQFGLGSKSPFAYADNFLVNSRLEGTDYAYAVYKQNGIPTITLLSETPTSEPNGITIAIPVDPNDNWDFEAAGLHILPWFPNIKTNLPLTAPNPLWTTPSGSIHDEPLLTRCSLYIKVGPVLYKVNHQTIKPYINPIEFSYAGTGQVILNMDIGQLDIVPNREDFSYTEETCRRITQKLNSFIEEFTKHVQKTIPQCTDINDYHRQFYNLSNLIEWIYKWDSKKLYYPGHQGETPSVYVKEPIPDDIQVYAISSTRSRKTIRLESKNAWYVHQKNKIHLYYAPPGTKRLKERLAQVCNLRNTTQHYLVLSEQPEAVKKNLETLSGQKITHFTDLSNLSLPPQQRYKAQRTQCKDIFGTVNIIDPDETFYYLKIVNDQETETGLSTSIFDNLTRFLGAHTNDYVIPYLLPKSKHTLAKHGVSYIEYAREELTTLINQYTLESEQLITAKNFAKFHEWESTICRNRNCQQPIPSQFIQHIDAYTHTITRKQNLLEGLLEWARVFHLSIPTPNPTLLQEIKDTYIRYKPFFTQRIVIDDAPALLLAYENYLKETAHA